MRINRTIDMDTLKEDTGPKRPWHTLDGDQVLKLLDSGPDGLSTDEATRRLEQYGYNRLPPPQTRSALMRLLAQFNNLLIQVLIGAAAVTAAIGHWIDAGVIMAVVIVNTIIGFIQEGRAEQALDAIRHMLAPNASVTRDGNRHTLPAEELVPGDLVLLEPGDKVPADLRLLKIKGLRIQEAVLTGESVPVDKSAEAVGEKTDLGDRRCMAFSGTLVAAGLGTGIVVATGPQTEIGRISGMLTEVQSMTTPLLEQMAVFARRLTFVILCAVTLVFLFGYFVQDQAVVEMFLIVVALAVAAIPEGLPAILTVTLAIGVQRMASRNAIIRRLPSVETLGAVSVICSDKTGTLTRNEMTVRTVALAGRTLATTGTGYDPHGEFRFDDTDVDADQDPLLGEILRAGVLCNDSSLRRRDGDWRVDGDPMEGALLVAAIKAGFDVAVERKRYTRTDEIPFEAAHRFMAVLDHDHEGNGYIYVKGAPEKVIGMCDRERDDDGDRPIDADDWRRRIDGIAAEGQRVLAVAVRPVSGEQSTLNFDDVESGLVMLGLVGLMDPPREEAIDAIAECQSAGIRVKMITGDHAATAVAIATQLGLANCREVVTGRDLDEMDDQTFADTAERIDVFARTTPEHKLRLVEALQANGKVIAMTGDGVNDSPALKRADVGVAMGRNGTEAAKEASEMVLADDNFVSIAHAVREGRTVYDNLKKAILFLLPINGGESLGILAAVLIGITLPITPLQILWVNMVSSVVLAMSLAFEPAEPEVMKRPPRRRDDPILSGFLVWRIFVVSLLFVAGIFTMFFWSLANGTDIEVARTHAVNALVVMEVFYLFNVRYLGSGSFSWNRLLGTRAVWMSLSVVVILQLTFTYAPFMQLFFETRPVDFIHGAAIIGIGILLFVILELEKWLRRKLV
jgi:magnesium-transporting ATPase (P-type)